MKLLLIVLTVVMSFNVSARRDEQEDDITASGADEYEHSKSPKTVRHEEIEEKLQQMQASGQISAAEVAITREYMNSMGHEEWRAIRKKAKDCIERNPAAVEKAQQGETLDKNACD